MKNFTYACHECKSADYKFWHALFTYDPRSLFVKEGCFGFPLSLTKKFHFVTCGSNCTKKTISTTTALKGKEGSGLTLQNDGKVKG